jgi:hypothetical protein
MKNITYQNILLTIFQLLIDLAHLHITKINNVNNAKNNIMMRLYCLYSFIMNLNIYILL